MTKPSRGAVELAEKILTSENVNKAFVKQLHQLVGSCQRPQDIALASGGLKDAITVVIDAHRPQVDYEKVVRAIESQANEANYQFEAGTHEQYMFGFLTGFQNSAKKILALLKREIEGGK